MDLRIDRRRLRLILSVSLYGGALSLAIAIISQVAKARHWEDPIHPPLPVALYLGLTGFIAGALVAALLVRLFCEDVRPARGLHIWALLGLIYGVLAPVITGALIPPSTIVRLLLLGQIGFRDFVDGMIDSLFHMPWSAIIQGTTAIPAGLTAGVLFALFSWLIDRTNASSSPRVSSRVSPVIGIALALLVLAFVAFSPAAWLSKLGWGP